MTFYILSPAIYLHGAQVGLQTMNFGMAFLGSVPSGKQWIVLGDFNSRVGSRVYLDDQWTGGDLMVLEN